MYNKILPELYSSYRVVTDLMVTFGLIIKHDKSEIFHFSKVHNDSNPELDLSAIGTPTLKPKTYWRYLDFYFDQYLFFKEHICYYSTKVLSMVKVMRMFGNSTRDLLLLQKYLFYYFCVVPIATYGFRLWFFAGAPTKAQVSLLAAMQCKATLWILCAFYTLPAGGIETLVGLIPIYLYLKKLVKQFCLRTATLLLQYVPMSLLRTKHFKSASSHPQSLTLLNDTQYACLKGHLLDTEASLLNLIECFDSLYAEAISGYRLLDSFPDHISFHPFNCSSLRDCKTHLQSLDCLCLEASFSPSTLVVVTDASVIPSRHMQAVSAVHIQNIDQQVLFSKSPASKITTPDTELFVIKLGIAKATNMVIEYIIFITDSLGSAR